MDQPNVNQPPEDTSHPNPSSTNTHEQTTQENNGSNGTAANGQTEDPQGNNQSGQKAAQEEFKVSGDEVVEKIKHIIAEGNARRIIIKNEEGKTLMEIPLTWGVVGAALLPIWAAVGALTALVARLTIVVEKKDQ